jgi:ribonuclease HI
MKHWSIWKNRGTNNQTEYEALFFGLQFLVHVGAMEIRLW